jgi:hypothetical protein
MNVAVCAKALKSQLCGQLFLKFSSLSLNIHGFQYFMDLYMRPYGLIVVLHNFLKSGRAKSCPQYGLLCHLTHVSVIVCK